VENKRHSPHFREANRSILTAAGRKSRRKNTILGRFFVLGQVVFCRLRLRKCGDLSSLRSRKRHSILHHFKLTHYPIFL
jgi:hypothetical protein